jgi:hypothetical protein
VFVGTNTNFSLISSSLHRLKPKLLLLKQKKLLLLKPNLKAEKMLEDESCKITKTAKVLHG